MKDSSSKSSSENTSDNPAQWAGFDAEEVRIFDTTLRDGEQAPGFSMGRKAKLRMAHMLEELGVDIIEAGFPIASPDDFASVRDIARSVRNATVCGLARCQAGDIDRAAEALADARHSRIHVFIGTSPLHREYKLGMSRQQVLDAAIAGVERAVQQCHEVEFSAEDAMRTEPEFLAEIFSAAAAAGASTLNVPDTVGYMTPEEIARRFRWLRQNVAGAEDVIFSSHCHDDLGLAVANSLAAVEAGARQVECTLNGIGERAGNASLEEIVMALNVRAAHFGFGTRINTRKLYPASRLLSSLTGQEVPRNKAIVGANAFAHESGIHQHGMIKHRETYEIMRPQDVGIASTTLVLGKHSGRAALRQRLTALGHHPDEPALDAIFTRFKQLADRKSEVHDEDLEALALGLDPETSGPWALAQLDTRTHLSGSASATVRLSHADGAMRTATAQGDGPVDAALRAMEQAAERVMEVLGFRLRAIGGGGDAQGHAHLTTRWNEREWQGHGVSTDIVEAAVLAALSILNRIERNQGGSQAQPAAAS